MVVGATSFEFSGSWADFVKSNEPIENFDAFLDSDFLANRVDHAKDLDTTLRVAASISLIAASAIIWKIFHSHRGLSTTYHRLLFGLSVAVSMHAIAQIFGGTPVPQEMEYFIPSARGNMRSCEIQGIFNAMGFGMTWMYNNCICLFYLAIIRYNKTDVFIAKRVEVWFHIFTILIPLCTTAAAYSMNLFNTSQIQCAPIENSPPHCHGVDPGETPVGKTIPCGRGNGKGGLFYWVINASLLVVSILIVTMSMTLIYRHVLGLEEKMNKYGVRALRLRVMSKMQVDHSNHRRRIILSKINRLMFISCFYKCAAPSQNEPKILSNSVKSKKRAVFLMAVGFGSAWVLTFVPYIALFASPSPAAETCSYMLGSLQGVYYFFAYMYPEVRNAKHSKRRGKPDLSWSEAFIKAWKSKGKRKVEELSSVKTRRIKVESRKITDSPPPQISDRSFSRLHHRPVEEEGITQSRSSVPSLYLHNPSALSDTKIDSGPVLTPPSLPKISEIQVKSISFDPSLRNISVNDTAKDRDPSE